MDLEQRRGGRVTVVSGSLAGGGAERVAIDLCSYLRHHGWDVTLLTLTGNFPDAYKPPEGVRRIRMEIRHHPPSLPHRAWYLLGRILAVRRQLISFRPDVVVSFIDRVNILTLISLLGTGIPVIVSERVHPGHNPIAHAWLIIRKLVYPLAKAITVQTSQGAKWMRRHMWTRHPVVIPNAVRFAGELAESRNATAKVPPGPLLLAVGRLTGQKGFDLLLNAFHLSGLVQTGWRLAILGEGPDLSALRQKAAALDMADAVTFPGFVDVGPWLEKADMFVMSSRYEGFPNALMEAMQMGRACISFDCPSGPRDLIEDGQNGLLVPALDVTALSNALRQLATEPALRGRLGAEAFKVNERLAPDKVYRMWLDLIDAVAWGQVPADSAPGTQSSRGDRSTRRSQLGEG